MPLALPTSCAVGLPQAGEEIRELLASMIVAGSLCLQLRVSLHDASQLRHYQASTHTMPPPIPGHRLDVAQTAQQSDSPV